MLKHDYELTWEQFSASFVSYRLYCKRCGFTYHSSREKPDIMVQYGSCEENILRDVMEE